MKVQVEDVDRVRRRIEVILDEENVRELENDLYEDLGKAGEDKRISGRQDSTISAGLPIIKMLWMRN